MDAETAKTNSQVTPESPDSFSKIVAQAKAVAESQDKDLPSTYSSSEQIAELPEPVYGDTFGQIDVQQNGLNATANIQDDGRVDMRISEESQTMSKLLIPALRKQIGAQQSINTPRSNIGFGPRDFASSLREAKQVPHLNVVIQVVGSRGDIQPFVALGKVLRQKFKHRVRIATHESFRNFVNNNGLEFFSIGGDPAELMAFMVKNPGLMPGSDALKKGDIGKRRKTMYDIIQGCWRSCFEAGDGTGVAVSDREPSEDFDVNNRPFVADAIIANPPSFAHVHCAEKLGIPLHLMFTMPWSPTQLFPHPLANIRASNTDPSMSNFLSYVLVELMTWQGLGDLVNRFRENTLGLEPLSLMWAPGIAHRLKIPYTYCWSPSLIPKPGDWGPQLSVSGFFFLSCADDYEPSPELVQFLQQGPPPVYIGFGSIVVDDPDSLTEIIFRAIEQCGQRALVSKGWGGLGAGSLRAPNNVFMLGNVPHDWLFKHVSCVVHHGGAGTTAAGIATGKPTVIVPFFGDQSFWGSMVAKAGAGPEPIQSKDLDVQRLAKAISFALQPSVVERAAKLGEQIASESGSVNGAESFHSALGLDELRCSILPERVAIWKVKHNGLRLSALAASVLGNAGLLDYGDLELFRSKEYDVDETPWDPVGGAAAALASTIGSLMMGVADIPAEVFGLFSRFSNRKKSTCSEISAEDAHPKVNLPLPDRSVEHTQAKVSDKTSHDRITIDSAIGTGRGLARIIDAGLKSPMDFTLALAKGFHNAPKLYGDNSVRPVEKITGFRSGIRAASRGLGFGLYDGISGLVTHPLEGAKQQGLAGFVKGFGKGIGGVVLKPGAAFWGVPGYTFRGIYKELQKHFGSSSLNYIIAARTAQGYEEWYNSAESDRLTILSRWYEGNRQNEASRSSTSSADTLTHEDGSSSTPKTTAQPISNQLHLDYPSFETAGQEDYETAIQEAVKATSTGDSEEDILIERAIRASIVNLKVDESASHNYRQLSPTSTSEPGTDPHYEMDEYVHSDDDDNIKEALRRSKVSRSPDTETRRAIVDSERSQQEEIRKQREEEMIMEHVLQQSIIDSSKNSD